MSVDQFLNQLKTVIAQIMSWALLIGALILSILLLSTLAKLTGHPIPYIPALPGTMQELGIFAAGVMYALRK
jgi:CHASE2 domain-containing sensor protein